MLLAYFNLKKCFSSGFFSHKISDLAQVGCFSFFMRFPI